MSHLGSESGQKRLMSAAKSYYFLNYSVIPVWGDKQNGREKVAAVDWKTYQYRRADMAQIDRWFSQDQFGGLAIVTGRISSLIVLDFDDAQLAEEFAQRFPTLIQTRIVESASRALPHYYFHIPSELSVPSRRESGVDLQSDGRYVLAPPTQLNDQPYRLRRGGIPLSLNAHQVGSIMRFLDERRPVLPTIAVKTDLKPASELLIRPDLKIPDSTSLRALYDHSLSLGRNQALFRVARQARDAGWSAEDVCAVLAEHHSHTAPVGALHNPETITLRRSEATKTIASVFTRAPQQARDKVQTGLPNSVREALLQQNQLALLRVLEALHLRGFAEGALVTEKQLCDSLQDLIGRYSIRKALSAQFDDSSPVFTPVNPSPRPSTHTFVAKDAALESNNKCLLLNRTGSDKNQRGRPVRQYVVPTVAVLCQKLGVQWSPSDPLQEPQLGVQAYRVALHEQLLLRRPGTYSRKWLAQRLGVSVRSCRRYDRVSGLSVQPAYQYQMISWANLNIIPMGIPVGGMHIEDEAGKRYPPHQGIARRLLRQGRKLRFVQRTFNHYGPSGIGTDLARYTDISESRQKAPKYAVAAPEVKLSMQGGVLPQIASETLPPPKSQTIAAMVLSVPVTKAAQATPESLPRRVYRKPLEDQRSETLAGRVYDTLRGLCKDNSGYLSRLKARYLVAVYGFNAVQRALYVLMTRSGIDNPAGFLITVLRSEAKLAPTGI